MKVLNKFEFRAGVGTESQYDWDKILSGKIIQLEEGADYTCKTATFRTLAMNTAKRRGMGVRVNAVEGGLVIQAYEATPEQLAKWESQDADAKERAKQRRAEKKAEK